MRYCTTDLLWRQLAPSFRDRRINQVVASLLTALMLVLQSAVAAEFQYFVADPPPLDEVIHTEKSEPETSSFEDQVRDMRIWLRQRDSERRQGGGPLDLSLPEEFARPGAGAAISQPTDPFQDAPLDETGYRTWGNTHFKLRNYDGGSSRRTGHYAGKHGKAGKQSASSIGNSKKSGAKANKETSSAKQHSKTANDAKKGSEKKQPVRAPAVHKEKPVAAAPATHKKPSGKPDKPKTGLKAKK